MIIFGYVVMKQICVAPIKLSNLVHILTTFCLKSFDSDLGIVIQTDL